MTDRNKSPAAGDAATDALPPAAAPAGAGARAVRSASPRADKSHEPARAATARRPSAAAAAAAAYPLPRTPWAVLGAVLLLALAWQLSDVLLLAFAGVLFALLLLHLGAPLQRRFGWSPRAALFAVVVGLVVLLGGGTWLVGAGAADQLQTLGETLPRALQALRDWLSGHAPGRWVLKAWTALSPAPDALPQLAGWATATFSAAGSAVLVAAVGVYLAADPGLYRRGALAVVPPARRPLAQRALDACGHDLTRWLIGQGVSMLAVGLATAAGLAAIGMPLVAALAMVAGALEFIPYFGPLVAGALIVAVALTEGEQLALWAVLVVFAVQQLEAYVVQPLAQRWAVRLAPVLAMLSVLIFGVLFGLPGVVLAVPLIVLTQSLVGVLVVERHEQKDGPDGPVSAG